MKPAIFAFSGRIASGKTTVALAVSKALNWKYASFGGFIRKTAERKNIYQPTREVLQEIGSELIDSGWENFCWAVIHDAFWEKNEGLVLDGIRHIECLITLRKILYPMEVFSIYIDVNEETHNLRLSNRGISKENLTLIEQHSTEIQVENLISSADLILDGTNTIDVIIHNVEYWLLSRA